ncbi:Rv3654c family TadE-like protein [uncultured Microbacterium sp.]|jgi:secretion/DNA translocation related TadE-like protein|uniref:Rv3654c family TadE-like protein n=1 Tax=uncultured Microbacterium sp. TaxID=191216 RepID=UPI0025F643CE|nr:Rv3654c family TadE-like protein [uncultured Microbacterium sp.]
MPGALGIVGIMGAAVTLTIGVAAAGGAAVVSQRIAGAADNAAIAAADTASGRLGGEPCDNASRVAEAHGSTLTACDGVGGTVTVTVEAQFAGIPVSARARAGPPPDS